MYNPMMISFVSSTQRTKRYHFHAAKNLKLHGQNIHGLNFLKNNGDASLPNTVILTIYNHISQLAPSSDH